VGEQVGAQVAQQPDAADLLQAGLRAREDSAVDVLVGVDDRRAPDVAVGDGEGVLRARAAVGDQLGQHRGVGARLVAQVAQERLDLLHRQSDDAAPAPGGRLADRLDRVGVDLAPDHRLAEHRLQDGERLAHRRRADAVVLEV
jgi:hypothetical protein